LLGRSIGGRKLQGIGSAQRMHPKKANRGLADDVTRLDFLPAAAQLPQPFENAGRVARIERTITLYPGQRRSALDLGAPPNEHGGILFGQRLHRPARCFGHEERTIAEASQNLIGRPAALQ